MHPLWLAQENGAAVGAVHGFCRAAEIQVDTGSAKLCCACSIVGQHRSLAAQQLQVHRYPGSGSSAGVQLRAEAAKHTRWQQAISDAHKLGDTAVDAAQRGEQLAHDMVDNALHGSEHQAHGNSSTKEFMWGIILFYSLL